MADLRTNTNDFDATRVHIHGRPVVSVLLPGDVHSRERETDNGHLGGTSDETIQWQRACLRVVPGTHVRGALVACPGADPVSESNGATNVPEACHPCNSTVEGNASHVVYTVRVDGQ